jgi:uncharacterized protein
MLPKYLYVILMHNKEKLNEDVVTRHVSHLKYMEDSGKLVLCGPCVDYAGGVLIINASSIEEAHELANMDPFIKDGYKTYEIRTMEWAHKENNYLL